MTTEPSRGPAPTLTEALTAWAQTEPAGAGDADSLARILQHADTISTPAAASRRPLWMAGGAVAASIAIALLLAPASDLGPGASPSPAANAPVILAEASTDTTAAFVLLYTPTTEEEYQL